MAIQWKASITGEYPHKGPECRALMFLWSQLKYDLNKQSNDWRIWDAIPLMWRQYNKTDLWGGQSECCRGVGGAPLIHDAIESVLGGHPGVVVQEVELQLRAGTERYHSHVGGRKANVHLRARNKHITNSYVLVKNSHRRLAGWIQLHP